MISPVDNTPPLTVNKRNVPHESNESNKQIKLDYAEPLHNASSTNLSMNSNLTTDVPPNPSYPLPYSIYPSMMMRYPDYSQATSMSIQIYSSYWDEQKTNILQLEFKGHIVTKRLDNHMVNGTKLLNLTEYFYNFKYNLHKSLRVSLVVNAILYLNKKLNVM